MNSQDRVFRGYTTLLNVVPSLRSLLNDADADPDDLDVYVSQVRRLRFILQTFIDLIPRHNSSRRVQTMLVVMMFGA